LLAAKAGACFVSPFVGRIDDSGWNGMELIQNIVLIYRSYGFSTRVLAASLRDVGHVIDAAKAGSHAGTMPFKVMDSLFNHPLTDKGVEQFLKDYDKVFHNAPVA
jgi:transaldolase